MTAPTSDAGRAALDELRERFGDHARDIKLNLQAVLEGGSLTDAQRWGVAVASAYAARQPDLTKALLIAARAVVSEDVIEDAKAAAVLLAMNNVFYRFRHFIEKDVYQGKAARLRMNRLVQAKTNKVDLELFSLAVSAVNACETCVKAHEKVVLEGGLSEDQVMDSIRIAAVVHAAALAVETSILP